VEKQKKPFSAYHSSVERRCEKQTLVENGFNNQFSFD
jgi:hypothetical protein